MRVQARLLKSAADKRGMIRSLPFAGGWTDRRDLPAPQGRTFREMYKEANSKA
jgi:L-lactate dehydrogenase complex protein LldF